MGKEREAPQCAMSYIERLELALEYSKNRVAWHQREVDHNLAEVTRLTAELEKAKENHDHHSI